MFGFKAKKQEKVEILPLDVFSLSEEAREEENIRFDVSSIYEVQTDNIIVVDAAKRFSIRYTVPTFIVLTAYRPKKTGQAYYTMRDTQNIVILLNHRGERFIDILFMMEDILEKNEHLEVWVMECLMSRIREYYAKNHISISLNTDHRVPDFSCD